MSYLEYRRLILKKFPEVLWPTRKLFIFATLRGYNQVLQLLAGYDGIYI